jgi:hypothetical protein
MDMHISATPVYVARRILVRVTRRDTIHELIHREKDATPLAKHINSIAK